MNVESNSFVPYNKTDFFFYTATNCSDISCGNEICEDITYGDNIDDNNQDVQNCLNKNLYEKLTQLQSNNGGAEQRYSDLNLKYYSDIYSIAYSCLGICIMFGIIKFA